jgi:DNA (cytosine-5)-methyltransferase 1
MDIQITAGQAAVLLDISVDTVRRWDKKGLVKSQRGLKNERLFNRSDIELLHAKLTGKHSHEFRILKNPEQTNHTAIELFAGAGGTALGLENAGFNHVLLSEIDKNACNTLRKNKPHWNVVEGDVAGLDFTSYKGKADVVQAGFPCQSFSYAGKKLGFEEARGTLFFEFLKCVQTVQPILAIGENVRGLERHDGGKTLDVMKRSLSDIGYRVETKVLRSQYLDVPQKRERLIIIAVNNKYSHVPIIFPDEKNYTISLREALKDCPKSPGSTYPPYKYSILNKVPEGGYWRDLPEELQKEYMGASYNMGGGKTGMARRLSWDEPCLTLTCSPAQKQTERCHPGATRPLTVREYARIQSFPDNWEFCGSIAQQYKQIGNAVPVNMAYHLGNSMLRMLRIAKEQNNIQPSGSRMISRRPRAASSRVRQEPVCTHAAV